jgi:hypothetical protein
MSASFFADASFSCGGLVGIVLLLRDLGLVHQRLHACQVGLSAVVIGLLGAHVGLRKCQV